MTPDESRRVRTGLGITAERLAILAGLAEKTVVRFEASSVRSRPGTVIALTRALREADNAKHPM